MYQHVLVPLDGSAFGEQALPTACWIARQAGAVLHLVHAYLPVSPEGMPVVDSHLKALGHHHDHSYLQVLSERIGAEWGLTMATALLELPAAESIAGYARANRVDLLVLTTHGRGGFSRLWLGSVADELVHCCEQPLLVLRPGKMAASDPPACRRILIPLDGSELSAQIVPHGARLGALFGAEYTLLQVVQPARDTLLLSGFHDPELDRETLEEHQAQAEQQLTALAGELRAAGHTVQTQVLVAEQPAPAIIDSVAELKIDLIAMATHGHGGLARLLMGSVADKVLRGVEVPLLLYHPRQ